MADYTILIVDYEPKSIDAARIPLAQAGYKVEVATDGVAGLEAFGRIKPDLVLIEAMLPKKHGFEVCQTIKKSPQGKRTPVLITTAVYKGRKYRTQALHIYGCDEYIEKPIAPERLVELCGRFLSGGVAPQEQADRSAPVAPAKASAQSPVLQRTQAEFTGAKNPGEIRSSGLSSSSAAAIVADLTEEEIMARLDAILPDDGMRLPSWPGAAVVPDLGPEMLATAAAVPETVLVENLDPSFEPSPAASFAEPFEPPIGRLPAISTAEPTFTMAAAGSPVTETLPAGESTEVESEDAWTEADPHVVRFDATRARKRRRSGLERPSSTGGVPLAVSPAQTSALAEPRHEEPSRREEPLPAVAARPEIREEPRVAVAASVRDSVILPVGSHPRPRAPWWVWVAVVGVVASGALYLMLGTANRNGPEDSKSVAQGSPLVEGKVSSSEEGLKVARNDLLSASPVKKVPVAGRRGATANLPATKPDPRPKTPVSAPPAAAALPRPAPVRVEEPLAVAQSHSAPRVAQEARNDAAAPASHKGELPAQGGSPPPVVQEARPVVPAAVVQQQAAPPVASSQAPNPSSSGAGAAPSPAPKKTVTRGALMNLDEVDSAPVTVKRDAPAYTARARQLRQRGSVFLNILVDETGKVSDVQVIQGIPGSDLNESAERAARSWTYEPALKDGVPVKVWKFEKLRFEP